MQTEKRSTRVILLTVAVLVMVAGSSSLSAERQRAEHSTAEADPWGPLKQLVGSWEGQIDGKLGTGKGIRRYDFILGDRYLMARHSSVRLPQEKSPQGDQHEEIGIFSFDSERQTIVFRAFMIEGFVNRYTCDTEPAKIVCVTESVESGPGTRVRLKIEIADRYSFVEHCEIAWPGRDLEPYFTVRWTRAPTLAAGH